MRPAGFTVTAAQPAPPKVRVCVKKKRKETLLPPTRVRQLPPPSWQGKPRALNAGGVLFSGTKFGPSAVAGTGFHAGAPACVSVSVYVRWMEGSLLLNAP